MPRDGAQRRDEQSGRAREARTERQFAPTTHPSLQVVEALMSDHRPQNVAVVALQPEVRSLRDLELSLIGLEDKTVMARSGTNARSAVEQDMTLPPYISVGLPTMPQRPGAE